MAILGLRKLSPGFLAVLFPPPLLQFSVRRRNVIFLLRDSFPDEVVPRSGTCPWSKRILETPGLVPNTRSVARGCLVFKTVGFFCFVGKSLPRRQRVPPPWNPLCAWKSWCTPKSASPCVRVSRGQKWKAHLQTEHELRMALLSVTPRG